MYKAQRLSRPQPGRCAVGGDGQIALLARCEARRARVASLEARALRAKLRGHEEASAAEGKFYKWAQWNAADPGPIALAPLPGPKPRLWEAGPMRQLAAGSALW